MARARFVRALLVIGLLLGAPDSAGHAAGTQTATPTPVATASPCPAQVVARQHLYQPSAQLSHVAALSATDIWATGLITATTSVSGTFLLFLEHFNGQAWCAVDAGRAGSIIAAIGANLAAPSGQADQQSRERTWQALVSLPSPARFGLPSLGDVTASSPTNVWSASSRGGEPSVERWDGKRWRGVPLVGPGGTPVPPPWPIVTRAFTDTWGLTGGTEQDQYILVHWDGRQWSEKPLPLPPDDLGRAESCQFYPLQLYLNSLVAPAPNDVWVGGISIGSSDSPGLCPFLYHWDGKSVQQVILQGPGQQLARLGPMPYGWGINAMAAVGPHDIWAAAEVGIGSSALLHWDGKSWRVVTTIPFEVLDMSAPSSNDVWAAGYGCGGQQIGAACQQPNLYHWDGKRWQGVMAIPAG